MGHYRNEANRLYGVTYRRRRTRPLGGSAAKIKKATADGAGLPYYENLKSACLQ